MLAVLDAATVARLQALVAVAAPVAAPTSEPQALMLEPAAEMKVKKTLSPEHLAKMKAGREAAKLKKQLEATASLAPVAALEAADTLVSVGALEAAPVAEWTARVEAALEAEVVASLAAPPGAPAVEADWGPEVRAALAAPVLTMKGNKRTSKPSAWSDWVKKIMAERKDEIAAHKEAAEQKAGAHLKWLAANAGKTSPEWLAFKAAWTLEHAQAQPQQAPPVSAVASDDEAPVAAVGGGGSVAAAAAVPVAAAAAAPVKRGPKPMVEMSAEELKAFLEAKKAKKAAAAAAADAETEPDEPEPVVTPPIAKKRGPKPLANMTAEERAAHDAKVAERKVAKEAKARAAEAALALVAKMQAAH